jgi:hypothetical protein
MERESVIIWKAASKSVSFEIIASVVRSFLTAYEIPSEVRKFMGMLFDRSIKIIFNEKFQLITRVIPLPIIQETMEAFLTDSYSGPVDRSLLKVQFMKEIKLAGFTAYLEFLVTTPAQALSESYLRVSLSLSPGEAKRLEQLMQELGLEGEKRLSMQEPAAHVLR